MVLKDDTINQTMLVPMDLRNLIPEDHPCYFIKNVVDQIDCSEANKEFRDKPGEPAYPREMLLRLVLMSVFDGGLSSREIERRTRTDLAYMYLAGMQKPVYRTILRFKLDYPDLIDEAFKTTLKIAKEEDLIKIHHLSLDGTKVKAKTSLKNITNEQQLKIMKEHLEESIKLDQEEDLELGDESGNSVPESLTNKEKFQKTVEKINKSSKNDIAVGLGNSVHLYTTNQTQENILFTYNNNNTIDKYVSSLIISQDGELLAVGNSEGFIEIYDINTQKIVTSFGGHDSRIGVVAWNNNIISSGSKDCSILNRDYRCNNLNSNNIINKLCMHNQEVCGLKWSFDGTQLASGGNDNKLMIWNLHSNSPLMNENSHTAAVKAIAWSPHQHNILSSGGGTADRTIRFWNTSNFNLIDKIDTGSQVCNLVFSRTSNEIVSTHGFSLNQINIWKLPNLTKTATLIGHTFRVLYLGLSPNGQNIVTGAGDQTLKFWNVFPPFKADNNSNLFPSNRDFR